MITKTKVKDGCVNRTDASNRAGIAKPFVRLGSKTMNCMGVRFRFDSHLTEIIWPSRTQKHQRNTTIKQMTMTISCGYPIMELRSQHHRVQRRYLPPSCSEPASVW